MADTEILVATAALVVSVVAFIATVMQCLQQYYASARGYSQCNEKVVGKWATTKSRRFSIEELRFEVQFDAPVIFVCPPKNQFFPIPDAPMYQVDGTEKSLQNTWTTLAMTQREEMKSMSTKEKIHTSDNERASWTILLSAIQNMEKKSRIWHEAQFKSDLGKEPPSEVDSFKLHGLPIEPPSLEDSHTLMVALQRKRKSWDTMPASITRPYATTTMCHLVEMMAALGIYWKEFNRRNDRYRAEGNGFMVLGERFSDLGLMFSFQVNGRANFNSNRVIPVDEVKELCFGWVPTIFRLTQDFRRLEVPAEVLDLSSLQMGARGEIAETLVMIGCNTYAVNHYLDEGRRTSHIFPLSFEILGMLAQTFHIDDTFFTYIPNPTPDRWDKMSVSLIKMMEAFRCFFKVDIPEVRRNKRIVDRLDHHMEEILSYQGDHNVEMLLRFRALHAALSDADEILTAKHKTPRNQDVPAMKGPAALPKTQTSTFSTPGLKRALTSIMRSPPVKTDDIPLATTDQAHNPQQPSKEVPAQQQRREKVQDVLRSHIQEVLQLLNDRDERLSERDPTLPVPQHPWGHLHQRSRSASPAPSRQGDLYSIHDVDTAGPDERQEELMKIYCENIRRKVLQSAARINNRRLSNFTGLRRGSSASASARSPTHIISPASMDTPVSPLTAQRPNLPTLQTGQMKSSEAEPEQSVATSDLEPVNIDFATEPAYHDDIWCTLVFRMICWLMLHDFNKLDVQIPKSELLGSRMPVYVA